MAEQEMWFHHVGVSVADLDGAIAWWTDMLGFVQQRRYRIESIPAEIAVLANGALHVELLQAEGSRPAEAGRRVPDDDLKVHGNKHIAFSVDDVRRFTETLRARGVDVVWIKDQPGGRAGSFVRDNEGNLIEFVQWPKADAPRAFIADQ